MAVDFLDELASGVSSVAAPDVQAELGVSYSVASLGLFVIPTLLGLVLEPPLLVLSDRWPKKVFICAGLCVMAAGCLAASLAPDFVWFTAAICAFYIGSGMGVGLSQAALSESYPDERERMMTRWTLMGIVGGLAAPALVAAIAALGLDWREAFVASGLALGAHAILLTTRRFPPRARREEEDEPVGLQAALWTAVRNPQLLAWLIGDWLTGLLDELLVVFGSLHLRDALGASIVERSVVIACFSVGAALGLLVLERVLKREEPLRVLWWSAIATGVAYPLFLVAPTLELSAVLLFLVGLFAAPHYPIARAQSYRTLPDRPGLLLAMSYLLTPATLALPLAVGALADAFGAGAALSSLLLQPVGVLVLIWIAKRFRTPGGDMS